MNIPTGNDFPEIQSVLFGHFFYFFYHITGDGNLIGQILFERDRICRRDTAGLILKNKENIKYQKDPYRHMSESFFIF